MQGGDVRIGFHKAADAFDVNAARVCRGQKGSHLAAFLQGSHAERGEEKGEVGRACGKITEREHFGRVFRHQLRRGIHDHVIVSVRAGGEKIVVDQILCRQNEVGFFNTEV